MSTVMKFDLSRLSENVKAMTEIFLAKQGHECGEGGIAVHRLVPRSRILNAKYDGQVLKIAAEEDVHFYRALHLFLQEIENGTAIPFVREEKIYFRETGLLLDCSRNGAVKKTMLKEFLRLCACCGINQLYLYMEDLYEIPKAPYFGAFRGRYTCADLQELDAYGKQVGVELIPAIQTLAHLHTYLRWPRAYNLRDTEDILLVGSKETEEFVRQMIHSVSRGFSTKKIHLGMDEADLLGLGRYLRENGYEQRYGIMAKHLNMVCNICREEGLEGMIWGDMYFRLKSPTGGYYDLPEETEFDVGIPEGLELVYWDYYQHESAIYDKNIRLHRKLTDKLRFAAGGWTWNGIAPNYSKAQRTIGEGLSSCRGQKVDKLMCTFWFDNGTETPVRTSFYSAIYFAQLCYHQSAEEKSLDVWLRQLTGYGKEEFLLLDAFDSPPGVKAENKSADDPSKYLLYQDTFAGLFDGQIRELGLNLYYEGLAKKLKKVVDTAHGAGEKSGFGEIFSYYYTLADFLTVKSMLGVRLREAYQSGDRRELTVLAGSLEECVEKADILKDKREKIWFSECRPFGFEVLDIRFGGVGTRLKSALKRIRAYLAGAADRLEELEEPLLLFHEDLEDKNHKLCSGGYWEHIISAGNIAGI